MLLFFVCQVLQSDFCIQNCQKKKKILCTYHLVMLLYVQLTFISFLDFSINSVRSPIIFQSCRKETRVLAYAIHVYNTASKNIELKSSALNLHLLTYLLTPWSRVLLDKLTSLQLVKKFPAFYGTRRFLTALTSARHLSLS